MDDYLWNKTGSDPELEQIESALKNLAYRPTAPPVLPPKRSAFAPPRGSLFRLRLSFAAALMAITTLGWAWFVLRNPQPAAHQAAAKTVYEIPAAVIRAEISAPAIAVSPRALAPGKPQRRTAAPRRMPANAIRPQTLMLTKEEADAYRQLITALSITSTNLKIVKDKLGGTE
ncbi:MAG: hypothetical protein ABIR33_06555 [Pyrinomonadaceae bacterium]